MANMRALGLSIILLCGACAKKPAAKAPASAAPALEHGDGAPAAEPAPTDVSKPKGDPCSGGEQR